MTEVQPTGITFGGRVTHPHLARFTAYAPLLISALIAITLCGCGKSPKGFYISTDTPQNTPQTCLEFKDNGHVIVRDLSSNADSVHETTFAVDKSTVRIQEFKLGGKSWAAEFTFEGETLVNAKGEKFVKDTSGKTYTPAERLAEREKARQAAAEREAQRAAQQAAREKEKEARDRESAARQQAIDAAELVKKVSKVEADLKAIEESKRLAALAAEEQTAKEAAKRHATTHLPTFTNQVVTLTSTENITYSNIALVRASLDGIVYRAPTGAGGGTIPYTKLSPETLETLQVDTNMIEVAAQRAQAKAQMEQQQTPTTATEPRRTTRYSPPSQTDRRSAPAPKRYGTPR